MRLDSLRLEKYGAFEDLELNFRADASLHIVMGVNEAGKSTSLQAISDLLFMFPPTIKAEDRRICRFKSAELRVGGVLRLSDDRQLAIRRKSGRGRTLLGATDKEVLDTDPLAAIFGGVDKPVFESEFGLNAAALRAGANAVLAANGRLAETLAAGSAGLSALSRLKGALLESARELYEYRASSRELPRALTRYQDADKALRDAIVTGEALKRAKDALDGAIAERTAKEKALTDSRATLRRLERASRTHEKLRLLQDAEATLCTFEDLPTFDAAQIERCDNDLAQAKSLVEKLAELDRQIAELQQQADELPLQADLLTHAADIASLMTGLGAALKDIEDLPRRQESMRMHQDALDAIAVQLGLEPAASLTERLPNALALAKVKETLRRKRDVEQLRQSARTRLGAAQQKHQELTRTTPAQIAMRDPKDLLQAFEGFASIPADARSLREMTARYGEDIAALEAEAARLNPPAGPLEAIVKLPLPGSGLVENAVRKFADLAQKRRDLEKNVAETAAEMTQRAVALEALTGMGPVATPEDWQTARRARDEAADRLASADIVSEPERLAALAVLRERIAAADHIAETLLAHAGRAARKQELVSQLDRLHHQDKALRASLDALQQDEVAAWRDWSSAWEPAGFKPGTPDVMLPWMMQVRRLVDLHGKLSSNRAAIASARDALSSLQAPLADFAMEAGLIQRADQNVELMFAATQSSLQALQKAWNANREHASALEHQVGVIAGIEDELSRIAEQEEHLQEAWDESMNILALPAASGAAEADKAVELWASAAENLREYNSYRHRVTTLTRDIDAFETHVGILATQFCTDTSGETAQRRVENLSQRVDDARRADSESRRLAAAIARARGDADKLKREHDTVLAGIAAIVAKLGLHEAAALPAALSRARQRLETEATINTLTQDLRQTSDGLDLAALKNELEGLDITGLPEEIDRLGAEAQRRLQAIAPAGAAEAQAQLAYDQLLAGRDVAALAQDKAEIAAEVLDISQRWLVRAAAARLAGLAIERHRRQAQDPVMTRISHLFRTATAGAFQSIVMDFDEDDQPVFMAVRKGGEALRIAGLSEGTADQLFLALRLALLETRTGESLPFVGDDLLTSFDDARTGQAIEMLADFGSVRQAVLFTHHRHVAEIALKRLGARADIVELPA